MATLQQLEEGIRRAHAAGKTEYVKALGAEYRRLQAAQQPTSTARRLTGVVTPQSSKPTEGSENITDLRQASSLPGALGGFQNFSNAFQSGATQGMTFGFGDELSAGLFTPIEMGIDLAQGRGLDIGRAYNTALERGRTSDDQAAALNPIANTVGEVTGAVVNPAAQASMVGKVPWLAKPFVGAAEGAAAGGLYGFGKGETLDERLAGAQSGALLGAGVGAVAPAIGGLIAGKGAAGQQRAMTNAAIKGAPKASQFYDEARTLFQAADNSGVTIDTNKFSQFVGGLVQRAKAQRINPTLNPNSTAAFESLIGALDDVQKSGGALTISDMHILRQIAQDAAVAAKPRDARFAKMIVDGLDDFITQPGVAVLPRNRLGGGGNPNQAGNDLLKAISMWGRGKKVSLIEEAVQNAENAASGFENGIRNEFRRLLKGQRHLFSAPEIQALEEVVQGSSLSNLTRLLGKFGFGAGQATNMMGGSVGAGLGALFGGPVGAMAAAGVGTGARKLSEVMARRAAERVGRVAATPNIPTFNRLPTPGVSIPFAAAAEALTQRR
jgi:hypothetical protein